MAVVNQERWINRTISQQLQQQPDRRRYADLSPLVTDPTPDYRAREFAFGHSPDSYSSLLSPVSPRSGLAQHKRPIHQQSQALRGQYSLENGMATTIRAAPRRLGVPCPQDYPRRHSSISSPLSLRLSRVAISPSTTPAWPVSQQRVFQSIVEETRSQLLAGVNGGELLRLGSVVTTRRSTTQSTSLIQEKPQLSARDAPMKLRKWGPAYLGNMGTADCFVRAVHLRKPDESAQPTVSVDADQLVSSDGQSKQKKETVVIRARITPQSKDRKPFLLQRKFDLQQLRHSLPAPQIVRTEDDAEVGTSSKDKGESLSEHVAKGRAKSTTSLPPITAVGSPSVPMSHTPSENPIIRQASAFAASAAPRRTMPIHMEYALHYLPVLSALMLSGHVRKGDHIDLPLPYPDAWRETVVWAYTGKGDLGDKVWANVEYLGGRLSQS